jgi:hypothetical protein
VCHQFSPVSLHLPLHPSLHLSLHLSLHPSLWSALPCAVVLMHLLLSPSGIKTGCRDEGRERELEAVHITNNVSTYLCAWFTYYYRHTTHTGVIALALLTKADLHYSLITSFNLYIRLRISLLLLFFMPFSILFYAFVYLYNIEHLLI